MGHSQPQEHLEPIVMASREALGTPGALGASWSPGSPGDLHGRRTQEMLVSSSKYFYDSKVT